MGCNESTPAAPSYSSLVLLMSCRSLTKLSKLALSTTVNQSPCATAMSACITQTSAPCETAVDNPTCFL